MTCYFTHKQEKEQPGGIRRTEIRYSGVIDEVGNLKLKRIVGKSFLDKTRKKAVLPSRMRSEIGTGIESTQPDKSA